MSCCEAHPVTNKRQPLGRTLLKADPTRTSLIRRAFIMELLRRARRLKKKVWDFLVTRDALALKPRKRNPFVRNVDTEPQPREYEFLTDAAKLSAFNIWVQRQIELEFYYPEPGTGTLSTRARAPILSSLITPPPGVGYGGSMGQGPWTTKYIDSAYKRGIINAYLSTKREAGEIDILQEDFLREAFLQPERISKVQLLATRSFEELKGVTAQIGSQMNRILSQGMIDGKSPRQIASEMTAKIDGLTNSRALTIARTEVIHAHAEGQLDSFEDLGVEDLGLEAEWSTAGDGRVCPICDARAGQVFKVDEARGLIPQHPNCRCTWIPKVE